MTTRKPTDSERRLAAAKEKHAKTLDESAKVHRREAASDARQACERLAASLRKQARDLRGGR